MTEIAFVLKAVTTLVSTLKKTPSANGEVLLVFLSALHYHLLTVFLDPCPTPGSQLEVG